MRNNILVISFLLTFQVTASAQGSLQKAIHDNMLPLFSLIGEWEITVKEANGEDTLRLFGNAKSMIERDTVRFKRDSASIKFNFTWDSRLTKDIMDISYINVSYFVDSAKYHVGICHEWKNDHVSFNGYSPTLDLAGKKLYFFNMDDTNLNQRVVLSRWIFTEDQIVLTHRERRLDPKQYRMFILTFKRKIS